MSGEFLQACEVFVCQTLWILPAPSLASTPPPLWWQAMRSALDAIGRTCLEALQVGLRMPVESSASLISILDHPTTVTAASHR